VSSPAGPEEITAFEIHSNTLEGEVLAKFSLFQVHCRLKDYNNDDN
jgi:hypothetical protein